MALAVLAHRHSAALALGAVVHFCRDVETGLALDGAALVTGGTEYDIDYVIHRVGKG